MVWDHAAEPTVASATMAMWSTREYVAGAAFRGPDAVAAAVLERIVEECLRLQGSK